jgi:hypothetical protein
MHAILLYHHGQRWKREDVHASQLVGIASCLHESFPRRALHHPGAYRDVSQEEHIFSKHPRMHDEFNFLTLDRTYEQVMRDGEEKMGSLLSMDDVPASLKILDVQMLLKKLIYNRWHYRLSIICLVQSHNAMTFAIRKTITYLAC